MSPASVTYYHGDHLGSSVVMTSDAAGSPLVRHIIYRPYGGVVVESAGGSSVPPEIGFTGQRFEKPAALYDYGARWYDPQLARFLQPDSLVPEPFNPQSLNRYSYVMNDPVNRIDPTGMSSILTGGGYYGESYGDFQQPPWERAGGIDLGYDPYQQLTHGPSRGTDQIQLSSVQAASPLGIGVPGFESQVAQPDFAEAVGQRFENLVKTGAFSTDAEVDAYVGGASTAYSTGGDRGLEEFIRENPAFGGTRAILETVFAGAGAVLRRPVNTLATQGSSRAIVFGGHGARHLAGTGLRQEAVENAIALEVRSATANAMSTGSFWGRVQVGAKTIEYRAYTLSDGTINVGTYYPLK